MSKKNEDDLLHFCNGNFQHPSYRAKTERFLQGVKERSRRCLLKVYQYDFPDTAEFNGSIMDCSVPVTEPMETYCELALMLFCPYQIRDDLTVDMSFVAKF